MTVRAVGVTHADRMVAEALATALDAYPGLAVVGVAISLTATEEAAGRLDAAALDTGLAGVCPAAERLRRRGVRVVLLGDAPDGEAVVVPRDRPVACLAAALVPGCVDASRRSSPLSAREREVLALVAAGFPAKGIARQLQVSVKTVERHKTRIFRKLGVANQAAAVRTATDRGLL